YKGRPIGNCTANGTVAACFSFHPIKNMTTGEGGMVTTDDAELATRIKLWKFHGVHRDAWKAYSASEKAPATYDVVLPGFKYNLTDIQSALGLHQLRKLPRFNARRAEIAAIYQKELTGIEGLGLPGTAPYDHVHPWHLFTVLAPQRAPFMDGLKELGIGTGLRFEVEAGADAQLLEAVHERRPLRREDGEQVPRMDVIVRRRAGQAETFDPGQLFLIDRRDLGAPGVEARQLAELMQTQRGLDVGQVVLEAGEHHVIGGRRFLRRRVGLPGVAVHAVELPQLDPRGELGVVGGDHAAFAGRHVLDRVEGEAGGHRAVRRAVADRTAFVGRAGGVRGVLEDHHV